MEGLKFLYRDKRLCVCLKPAGMLSTDEPGGLPELARSALGGDIFTVHRLDRVVGGVMVLARTRETASELSRQIRSGGFGKRYLAAVLGAPDGKCGEMRDLLMRDRARRMTVVVSEPQRYAQEAVLRYELLGEGRGMSLLRIELGTGRTHQIRAQLSSRGMPIAGDRKYGGGELDCPTALWSCAVSFTHPRTGRLMRFSAPPERAFSWDAFDEGLFSPDILEIK